MPVRVLGTIVALGALLLPVALPVTSGAGWEAPLRAVAVNHGVEVMLTLPHRTYPHGALVRATVWVAVQPGKRAFPAYLCNTPVVEVDVLDGKGNLVYPLLLPSGFPAPSCPPLPLVPRRSYPPDYAHTWHVYTLLWARHLQATFRVGVPPAPSISIALEITTPPVSVRLTPRSGPALSLPSLPRLVVLFHGSGVHHRTLRYHADFSCDTHEGVLYVASLNGWPAARGTRFMPQGASRCTRVRQVHLLAGYPDHPVARLDYSAPLGT